MKIIYRAALGMSSLNPDQKATRSEVITTSMQASGNFPDSIMTIPYSALAQLKINVHNAVVALGNGTGTTGQVQEEERVLVNAFNFVRSIVEKTANDSASPVAIIESAGMTVVTGSGNTSVTELTLTPMGNGVIQACVPRNTGEKAFAFYFSTDNINWVEFAMSTSATVELINQTPGAILYFRYVPIGKTKGVFSPSKSTVVL